MTIRALFIAAIATVGIALGAAAPAQTTDLADLVPQTPYGTVLLKELQRPSDDPVDFAALRAAYAADPGYTGRSRVFDDPALYAAITGKDAPPDPKTEDAYLRLLFADFPLVETQGAAITRYFEAGQKELAAYHIYVYRGLIDAILATRRDTPDGPVYTVLSIEEEYAIMHTLKREVTGQALLDLNGVPHDRLESAEGPVLFDISAFFGKYNTNP